MSPSEMAGRDSSHPEAEDLERAALFVLGSLPEAEERAFRAHLAGCAACTDEVGSLERTAGELALLTPAVPPDPSMKERLLARLGKGERAAARPKPNGASGAATSGAAASGAAASGAEVQAWKWWTADRTAGLSLVRASGSGFEPTGVEGVEVRRLFVDVENDRVTMLVRMLPGSSYPPHRHGGPEECFVLEGSIDVGELHMRAGDYQRASGGSLHPVQSTEEGCLLLIVSSLRDELLEAR